jgi:hypothetical protein
LKPLPNELLALIIKINLTTNYQLLLNCNKVHRAYPHMGSNTLVICVNIILLFDIINVLNLGGKDFIIFISVISWSHKVCIIRVILEIILVH